jgi:hypothetical protein
MRGLAPTLGLTLQSVEIRDPKNIDAAFAAIIRWCARNCATLSIIAGARVSPATAALMMSGNANGLSQRVLIEFDITREFLALRRSEPVDR